MKKILYIGLLSLGIALAFVILNENLIQQKHQASLEPLVKIMGQLPNAVSKTVSKVVTLADLDEEGLGKKLSDKYQSETFSESNEQKRSYAQELVDYLSSFKKKKFEYKAFIIEENVPNAMALPGGVILVTKGLMEVLKSESELVAILAHEMGHIENSHCLNAVKYELLTQKIDLNLIGSNLDLIRNILVRHSFSKLEEEEADEYGFQILLKSNYTPSSLPQSFMRLKAFSSTNAFTDVFGSHPSLDSRIEKYNELSKQWWMNNIGIRRYVGRKNFERFASLKRANFGHLETISQHSNLN